MKKGSVRVAYSLVGLATILIVTGLLLEEPLQRWIFEPTETQLETGTPNVPEAQDLIVAEGLSIPWEIAFLPGGDLLVTERPGTLARIGANMQRHDINGVEHVGEGGLLGLALHPEFERNGWLYLYLTTSSNEGVSNRVERYTYQADELSGRVEIIGNIPGAANHDGGRIAFGPDGMLYITTGDAGDEKLAQDTGSLAGKILRVNDDGSIPEDNPFKNAVYSYGHRNPQGIAWDEEGSLWSTEHGRSGIKSGFDELNLIEKGANYGWPLVQGDETMEGMIAPVVHSGPDDTWAPAGLAFHGGSLYFAGLRGQSLYEAKIITRDSLALTINLREVYGRLRAVVLGPGNMLYISTSNTDGRGQPKQGDDKIIRINPAILRDK